MGHLLQLALFAAILSLFFTFLQGGKRPRWKLGGVMWLSIVGGGLLVALMMYPFT